MFLINFRKKYTKVLTIENYVCDFNLMIVAVSRVFLFVLKKKKNSCATWLFVAQGLPIPVSWCAQLCAWPRRDRRGEGVLPQFGGRPHPTQDQGAHHAKDRHSRQDIRAGRLPLSLRNPGRSVATRQDIRAGWLPLSSGYSGRSVATLVSISGQVGCHSRQDIRAGRLPHHSCLFFLLCSVINLQQYLCVRSFCVILNLIQQFQYIDKLTIT